MFYYGTHFCYYISGVEAAYLYAIVVASVW